MEELEKLISAIEKNLYFHRQMYNVEIILDGFCLWCNQPEEGRKSLIIFVDGTTLEFDIFGTASFEMMGILRDNIKISLVG